MDIKNINWRVKKKIKTKCYANVKEIKEIEY